jgi:hypothetical protein
MTVKEYTEEFYRLNIRAGHIEEYVEKVSRYINGLIFDIQYEINLLSLRIIEYAYHATFKEEEKLPINQSQRNKGKSPTRGKGQSNIGRFQLSKEEERS